MSDRSEARRRRDRALLDRERSREDGAPEQRERADVQAAGEVLTVDEVCELYPGEWVIMEVLEHADGWPSRGRIIAHDPSRDRMQEVRLQLPRLPKDSDRTYYMFDAVRRLRTGDEVREALKRLSEMDVDIDEVGMRRW